MLILPALAVTLPPGSMAGWTTFVLAALVIPDEPRLTATTSPDWFQGHRANQMPESDFAAMSIEITLPVMVVGFLLQRWFISGPSFGAIKGRRG